MKPKKIYLLTLTATAISPAYGTNNLHTYAILAYRALVSLSFSQAFPYTGQSNFKPE
jgi:hypothetical protein